MERVRVVLAMGLVASLGLLPGTGAAQSAGDTEVPPEIPPRRAPSPRTGEPTAGSRNNVRIKGNRLQLTNRSTTGRSTTTGEYNGVTPGLPKMPRIRLPRAASKRCYLTWTGFQMLPNGSRIFLQLNRKPSFTVTNVGTSLTVLLKGCRVASWNNTRPLWTRFFPTPVKLARVRRRRGNTELRILLKRRVTARHRVTRLQGWYYLFVSFRHQRTGWTTRREQKVRVVRSKRGSGRAPRGPQAR